jgi:hypothetical protein
MVEYLSGRKNGQWICSMQWTGRIWRLPSPEFTRRLKQTPSGFVKFIINMPNTGKQKHLFTKSTGKNSTVSNNAPAANRTPKQLCTSTNASIRICIKKIFAASIELLFHAPGPVYSTKQIPMYVLLIMIMGIATVTSQDNQ